MEQTHQSNLVILTHSKEQVQLSAIKPQLSAYAKYFFAAKCNSTLVYDKNIVYIIGKLSTKIIDLGKSYLITQLIYHHQRDLLAFLVVEGIYYCYIIQTKTLVLIKKECKKQNLIGCLFNLKNFAQLFLAQETGIKIYKLEEDKKSFKEVKIIGQRFNAYLYQPETQTILAFPYGDCKTVFSYIFGEQQIKLQFKGPTINIHFQDNQNLCYLADHNKNLGIQGSKITKQVFYTSPQDQYMINVLKINKKPYFLFYFAVQGKVKLYPIQNQNPNVLMIKLPSDSFPCFNVVDDMLVIHLKNQKISFIYEIKDSQVQMLVSPFPLLHRQLTQCNIYSAQFIGKRIIFPLGYISKWKVNIPAIHFYLKNQEHIFDFFIRRTKAKTQMLYWIRQNLIKFKQRKLFRFWKEIFQKTKYTNQRDKVTLLDLYNDVFLPLFKLNTTQNQVLSNIVLECIRQALQHQYLIPIEMQTFIIKLLLNCKKYQHIVMLIYNDVIKGTEQLALSLFEIGKSLGQKMLETIGIDMGNRCCNQSQMLKFLGKTQQIREMKRFIKVNYEKMQILHLIYCGKYIKCLKMREQYLVYIRLFIMQKFPLTNPIYLDEAEKAIRNI